MLSTSCAWIPVKWVGFNHKEKVCQEPPDSLLAEHPLPQLPAQEGVTYREVVGYAINLRTDLHRCYSDKRAVKKLYDEEK